MVIGSLAVLSDVVRGDVLRNVAFFFWPGRPLDRLDGRFRVLCIHALWWLFFGVKGGRNLLPDFGL